MKDDNSVAFILIIIILFALFVCEIIFIHTNRLDFYYMKSKIEKVERINYLEDNNMLPEP